MSSSTKKSGTLGVNQKVDRNDGSTGGGSKGDSLTTTPSKSSKPVTKKALANSTSNKGGSDAVTNPAILNQQALEALYSATYVEDFIDCNDNMGDDLIRQTTRMFEMGSNYMTYIRELETAMAILLGDDDGDQITPDQLIGDKKKAVFRLQQVLITAQDTGDDSLQVMQGMQDHIENKTRQLDVDRKNLAEFCKEQDPSESAFKDPPPPTTERSIKRARRQRHEIYRPSILGPSSLKATSYPETVSTNLRDHEPHVVTTSSRSRDRDRSTDRNNQSSNQSSGSTAAVPVATPPPSSSEPPTPVPSEEVVQPTKPNGRSSERSGGSSSRSERSSATAAKEASAAAAAAEQVSSTTEKSERAERSSERSSGSGYNSSSNKKQSQRHQVQEKKTTKKRKAKQSSSNSNSKEDNSPQQYAIDPDEPTYCLCDQVSYGEMIGCDNDLCPIEWFHFSCVSLTTKPKGKWYCPKCRGDRPNVMKPKAIFLKELEKYNREKEEKA